MADIIYHFLHLDEFLKQIAVDYGTLVYVLLFLIIFTETGVVLFPLLPGDSLIFAAGSLCAIEGSGLHPHFMAASLVLAAFTGDNVNYNIGRWSGKAILKSKLQRFIKPQNIEKTEQYFLKYGNRSVVLGRFMPIIRTLMPFVAGIAQMNRRAFVMCSFFGSIAWIGLFFYSGYMFGNNSMVKRNFHIVIIGVIMISLLPIIIETWKHRRKS